MQLNIRHYFLLHRWAVVGAVLDSRNHSWVVGRMLVEGVDRSIVLHIEGNRIGYLGSMDCSFSIMQFIILMCVI
jgi:hypothetical protein